MPTNYDVRTPDLSGLAQSFAQGRALRKDFRDERMMKDAGQRFALGDLAGASGALARGGDVQGAAQLHKFGAEQQATQAKLKKERANMLAAGIQHVLSLPPEQQERAYEGLKAHAVVNLGVPAEMVPPKFEPARLQGYLAMHADAEKARDREAAMERTQADITSREKIAAGKGDKPKVKNVSIPGVGVRTGREVNGELEYKADDGTWQPAPPEAVIMGLTSTPQQQKEDRVARRKFNAAVDSTRRFLSYANDAIAEIDSGNFKTGTAGWLSTKANALRAEVTQLAGLFDVKDQSPLNKYLEFSAKEWDPDMLRKYDISAQRVNTAVSSMAYMKAKIEDDQGRVSDQDYLKNLQALAGGKSDPEVIRDTLIRESNRMLGLMKARGETQEYGVPEFPEWQHRDPDAGGAGARPGTRPSAFTAPNGKSITMEQIEATARKHNQTPEQVIRNLGLSPARQ